MNGATACMGRLTLVVALLSVLGAGALAQKQQDKKPPKPPPITVTGTVQQVAPGGVSVLSPANETWLVQIAPDARVEVTGTAEPELLGAGLFVRLMAMVDKRGRVADPVRQLTLIDLAESPGRRLGAFRPGQDELPAAGAEAGVQMPTPDLGDPPPGVDQVMLDMRGRIDSYRPGHLTVTVPAPRFKGPLRLELADPVHVALDVSNYSLAQPGDSITAKGVQIAADRAWANEVTIVLSAPVSDPKKRPERPEPTRRPARTPAEQEERKPFEVAQEMPEMEGAQEPPQSGPPAAVAEGPDVAEPAPPEERNAKTPPGPPGTSQQKVDKLVAMLTPEPDSDVAPDIRVGLGDAPPLTFTRCKPGVTRNDLRREFGQPDRLFDLRGKLPIGRGGALEPIEWEMWQYGEMRLLLDKTGMVWYRQTR